MIIYNVGSINIDHVYQVQQLVRPSETVASHTYTRLLGGKGANQSIALSQAGASVCHIGCYNADDEWIINTLEQYPTIALQHIEQGEEATGHAIIQVDDEGENAILLYPGSNSTLTESLIDKALEKAGEDDWLLLQNECNQRAYSLSIAAAKNIKIAMNPAPMDESIKQLPLQLLDLLVVNEIEACTLLNISEQQLHHIAQGLAIEEGLLKNPPPTPPQYTQELQTLTELLQSYCPKAQAVITLGAYGSLGWDMTKWHYVPAEQVDVVDSTAAGDTFTGYCLHHLMQGHSLLSAMEIATQAAALCVGRYGASSSIPHYNELDSYA